MAGKIAVAANGHTNHHSLGGTPTKRHTMIRRESTDDSSLTSVFSDTFDRVPDMPLSALSTLDANCDISRYGSNDAAEDTGPSSVSTSSHTEDKQLQNSIGTTPQSFVDVDNGGSSRKRLALSSLTSEASNSKRDAYSDAQPQATHPNGIHSRTNDISLTTLESPNTTTSPAARRSTKSQRLGQDLRSSSSIPSRISWEEYGRQCVLAAQSSRLNPYALHAGEYKLLRDRISPAHVTAYLNIRNGILRLWTRNPMVSVTREEAIGCAKESRYYGLADFAYPWLVRHGYINFGCVEVPRPIASPPRGRRSNKQKTIVIIGAGMSGLGCARQLEGLVTQLEDKWINQNENPPRVLVLEGRKRVGGRVYSHPLRTQVIGSLPDSLRNTAEMGAQIVTGFEHGNPLDPIIRGQLGLRYHLMWDEIVMHDADGHTVDHQRDMLVNKIHNDLLERTSDFRVKPSPVETLEGLSEYIDICQEPVTEELEDEKTLATNTTLRTAITATASERPAAVPPGFAKLQGRTQVVAGNSSSRTAAQAAKSAGWELRPGISRNHSLNLKHTAKSSAHPTLGATMDEAVRQYQSLVQLTPQDMRMLNWHYADLEYANASVVSNLSLGGHDQDSGNEFEGRHSEIVGGYVQVPRGLMMLPEPLDVRFQTTVKKIKYSPNGRGQAIIECSDGDVIEADQVVLTAPLGVLKAQAITFEPPLPDWKQGAIRRMGFGLLNKIVLVYERPFWDESYDMFGMLNEAEKQDSMNPDDFAEKRGKYYLVWNCIKNSGRPMLIALMAGRAAHDAEVTDTQTLLREVTQKLAKTFAPKTVPAPVEVIVTRWKKDPFTRGTYSFVAPETQPGDYDVMAAPVGNLHFAGEATCGTHPATVHGAYLSGLRAAAEVVEAMTEPMQVLQSLVGPRQAKEETAETMLARREVMQRIKPPIKLRLNKAAIKPKPDPQTIKIKQENTDDTIVLPVSPIHVNPYRSVNSSRATVNEDIEALVQSAIMTEVGLRPMKPARPGVNPFLVYTREHWNNCKDACSEQKRRQSGDADAKATRNEIRVALGKDWRNLSEEVKRPYLEQCEAAQQLANEARVQYERSVAQWDLEARRIRQDFIKDNALAAAAK